MHQLAAVGALHIEAKAASDSNDAQVQMLSAELATADQRLADIRKELDAARDEVRGLRDALGMRDAELAAARAEIQGTSAEAQADRQDKLRLQAKMKELESRVVEMREQLLAEMWEYSQLRCAFHEDPCRAEGSFMELELVKARLQEDLSQCSKGLGDIKVLRRKVERADRLIAPLEERVHELQEQFEREQRLRKKFQNQVQDAKGAIRVYARVRPISKREVEMNEQMAVEKQDEFSLKINFPSATKDPRSYIFDSIFNERSTQEDVYA